MLVNDGETCWKRRWLRDETKERTDGKKLVIYEKKATGGSVLHSEGGEPFLAPFLRVWRQKATKSLAAALFTKQLQDWMVLSAEELGRTTVAPVTCQEPGCAWPSGSPYAHGR